MEQDKRVIALGFFDGVHLGHGTLLRRAIERAQELKVRSAALTFHVRPEEVILGRKVPLLTTPEERAELMHRLYGIQDVFVERFDDQLMRMDWREFVTELLVARHGAVHLVAGHDYHFGYRGEGNPERLKELCAQLGIGCDIITPVIREDITVSSTYIRSLVLQGDMERAHQYLGHPHCLTEQVRHGKKLGSRLGFPTVNLHIPPGCAVPAFGVYATRLWVDGTSYAAATNVGVRPSVDTDGAVTVEGTLLDFNGSLYGKTVRMEFYKHIRPEQKFETLDDLRSQVMRDIETVRSYFA